MIRVNLFVDIQPFNKQGQCTTLGFQKTYTFFFFCICVNEVPTYILIIWILNLCHSSKHYVHVFMYLYQNYICIAKYYFENSNLFTMYSDQNDQKTLKNMMLSKKKIWPCLSRIKRVEKSSVMFPSKLYDIRNSTKKEKKTWLDVYIESNIWGVGRQQYDELFFSCQT